MSRTRFLLALSLALAPYALLVACFDFVCDDAYISFRYSRHLAEGRGLVFNPGESPPVEGYSNFLWVVWLALFERLGADVALAARATSIACGAGLVALVARFAQRRLELGLAGTAAAALYFSTLPAVAMWSTSGLESMPFALALFATFALLRGDPARPRGLAAGACALAAALLRADGALWVAAALAAAALEWPRGRSRRLLRALLTAAGVMAAGVAAHVLWRHTYYGEWLPNTAHVKTGFSALRLERGGRYLASLLLTVPSLLLALLAALATLGRPRPVLALQAAFVVLCGAAYAVYVGGDFMPMGRFLLPAMPFVALLFAGTLAAIGRRGRTGAALAGGLATAAVALSLLPSFDLHPVPLSVRERFHFRWNQDEHKSEYQHWSSMRSRGEHWLALGRALALHTRPGETMIIGSVGAVGFASELFLYDLFGLVSPEVARRETPPRRFSPGHDKRVDPDFFLDKEPDYAGAFLVPLGVPPESSLPPDWQRTKWARLVELETHPYAFGEGYPQEGTLVLLRFRWDRDG